MEILRYGQDTWGEPVVNGVAWGLLPVVFWAGIAVIVAHLLWRAFSRRGARRREGGSR